MNENVAPSQITYEFESSDIDYINDMKITTYPETDIISIDSKLVKTFACNKQKLMDCFEFILNTLSSDND